MSKTDKQKSDSIKSILDFLDGEGTPEEKKKEGEEDEFEGFEDISDAPPTPPVMTTASY